MAGGRRNSTVTIRRDLTEMAKEIDFSDLMLASDAVAPTIPVSKYAGYYPKLPKEAIMKVPDTRRQSDGAYARGQWEWEDDSYVTYEYGFEEPVDNVDAMRDEEYVNHEEMANQLAYQGLLLGRESRLATALYNTTTFTGTSNTTAITNEWDDATNATPWADINTASLTLRGKCGFPKETFSLILSDDLIDLVIMTDEIKNRFQYNSMLADVIRSTIMGKAKFLAAYFGIKEVIPVRSLYDTTGIASSATIGKFWSNEYAMLGKLAPAGAGMKTLGLVKQLAWSRYASDFIVEDYEEPAYNRVVVRAREYRGIKIETAFGHLLTNMKTTVSSTTGV